MLIKYHRIDPPAFVCEERGVPPKQGAVVTLNGQRFQIGTVRHGDGECVAEVRAHFL